MPRRPRQNPLEIIDDHMVARLRGRAAVLDTGSSMTFRAPAIVSERLRQPIRWLVGTDMLRRDRVLFDWPNRRLVVGGPALSGEAMELTPHDTGLFQIEVKGEHGSALAWLDTGAPLSYAPASVVRGCRPVGHQRDYMVGVGEYEVAVYELTVRVGRRQIRGRFGVLPELFAMALSLVGGTHWILGTNFFRDRAIQLDLANNRLIDATVVAPRQRTTSRAAGQGAGGHGGGTLTTTDGIEGWRGWRLADVGNGPTLRSISAPDVWDGPCFTSDALPTAMRRKPPGVHAFATPGQLQSVLRGSALVYGQVTLHGEVCIHEMGYRAEHARVDRLFLRACGRHSPTPLADTGLILPDSLTAQQPESFCACDALTANEWLRYEELEFVASQLGDRYQCDVMIDAERPRLPTYACRHIRRDGDIHTRRA